MMKILFLFPAILSVTLVKAQNVGIGTNEPLNKLQIAGNLLVNTPTKHSNAAPTAAQEKTIVNSSTIFFSGSDSTGRIFDPGGPSGNYLSNLTGNVTINGSTSIATEIIVETMQLGIGDSLIIKPTSASTTILLAVGNGYTATGKWVFNIDNLHLIFKSNGDGNNGTGFSILFRRLYDNSNTLPDISGVAGNALLFNTKSGAFASGHINLGEGGMHSVSMGSRTTASGEASVAMGYYTIASGIASSAFGYYSNASGGLSTALGYVSKAEGDYSSAIGYSSEALGYASVAIGYNTLAAGEASVALGAGTEASGKNSSTMGVGTTSRGYAGTSIGMYNSPLLFGPQTSPSGATPLFIVGNGDNESALSNAMIVRKDGNVGIGTDIPAANLHIKHAAGGGLILENANDNTKWRIYSASGDNNLTFYNNTGTEIADIDDVTGTFNALSDGRYKKDIQPMQPVLPTLMKLDPKYYHFNWQRPGEPRQIGFIAQESHCLFPELVSYSKEKDLYKMNYAGFSTIAIKAIQEQQQEIQELKARLEKLEALLLKR